MIENEKYNDKEVFIIVCLLFGKMAQKQLNTCRYHVNQGNILYANLKMKINVFPLHQIKSITYPIVDGKNRSVEHCG